MLLPSLFLIVTIHALCNAAEPPRISHGHAGDDTEANVNDEILQEILRQQTGSQQYDLSKDAASQGQRLGGGDNALTNDPDFELDLGRGDADAHLRDNQIPLGSNAGDTNDNNVAAGEGGDELPAVIQPHVQTEEVADDDVISAAKGQREIPFPPPPQASALRQTKRAGAQAGASNNVGDTVFIAVTTVCSAAAVFGLVGAGVCWYRLHRRYKSAEEAEYGPQYGVTGPGSKGGSPVNASSDQKLASSAHLYHYQHTKQQIIAMEQSGVDAKGQESDDSEGEGEEADYSVYECPGLAPTGDIEVSNPLFDNGPPVSPINKEAATGGSKGLQED